ncbi:MAG: GNAT family N-acetyltransferase [Acidimicrobiia bacterium]|nr:GNAT family N-acetyltransferase [Acidimicrobiia bacterium]
MERSATIEDLDAFVELFATSDRTDIGEQFLTRDDIEPSWEAPGFDGTRNTRLIYKGPVLVAAGMVLGRRAWGTVHPDFRGRNIGSRLIEWTEQAAASDRIGQSVIETLEDARALFIERGYETLYTSWVLRYDEDRNVPDSPPPAGIVIRPIHASEERAAYQVIEDAFNEWPHRTPLTFEEWRADTVERNDFDPSLLRVALDGNTIVGSIFGIHYPEEGWVDELAVARQYRRRGIARALLSSVFGEFRSRGQGVVGLNTDSRTGALDVYLGLGMELKLTFVHYSRQLKND